MQDPELLDLSDPDSLPEETLHRALTILTAEIRRRSLAACDPQALIEEGFASGFQSSGLPKDPQLRGGILVCSGAKIDRSAMNHRCAFVRIGQAWVWEHGEIIDDQVRYLPGAQTRMQSVSLVPVEEGTAVDLVEARTRNGVHELVGVRSFVVENGELTLVSDRSVGTVRHR